MKNCFLIKSKSNTEISIRSRNICFFFSTENEVMNMSKKTSTNMMKIMGATLAVCSAAAIMGGMKTSNSSAKKTMKKAGEKVVEFVDTVASFM